MQESRWRHGGWVPLQNICGASSPSQNRTAKPSAGPAMGWPLFVAQKQRSTSSALFPTPSFARCYLQQAANAAAPAKTRHLGPSLLTPTHLHCLSTSTGHLPCGPHPSSNHQIIVTISPKPYSTFQYPAKVSARVSKLCKSTGNPHTTAARSMYSSFSRGEIIYPGFRSCRQAQQF